MGPFAEARSFLRDCGIDDPDPDVKLLAAFAAGTPLRDALGAPLPDLDPEQDRRFRRLVARRGERREPVAYLVGSAAFLDLEVKVTPSVLIPRPSTERLAELALQGGPPTSFLDACTGSGVLALVLARAGARGAATDLSPRALEIARLNARHHGVEDRIRFVEADVFPPGPPERVDLLVSNPPYVSTSELAALPPEVKHEPRLALEAGVDGLDVIRRLVAGARERSSRLLLEVGSTQAGATRDLALQAGFADVRIHKDLDGHERVVEARC
jgi:release factor glutamine methyltransferase